MDPLDEIIRAAIWILAIGVSNAAIGGLVLTTKNPIHEHVGNGFVAVGVLNSAIGFVALGVWLTASVIFKFL